MNPATDVGKKDLPPGLRNRYSRQQMLCCQWHKRFYYESCCYWQCSARKLIFSPVFRFTEFFVDELENPNEIRILVADYLKGLSLAAAQIDGIVKFYGQLRHETIKQLTDGTGRRPHYSLRTLCRALRLAAANSAQNVPRSLYEAFCLSFLTQLDRASHPVVEQLIAQHVIGRDHYKTLLKRALPQPLRLASRFRKAAPTGSSPVWTVWMQTLPS